MSHFWGRIGLSPSLKRLLRVQRASASRVSIFRSAPESVSSTWLDGCPPARVVIAAIYCVLLLFCFLCGIYVWRQLLNRRCGSFLWYICIHHFFFTDFSPEGTAYYNDGYTLICNKVLLSSAPFLWISCQHLSLQKAHSFGIETSSCVSLFINIMNPRRPDSRRRCGCVSSFM